jgi:Winged helix DNA-binding domain
MAGTHAQIMPAAELGIGLRLAGVTRAQIREALWTGRTLVKTFGPRGTVHLLPAQDLPAWTGALSAIPSSPSPFPEGVRMTADQAEAVLEAIAKALSDAELTVEKLSEAVTEAAGSWAGDLVMPAFGVMWPGCGTSGARAAGWTSPWSRCDRSPAASAANSTARASGLARFSRPAPGWPSAP